MPAARFVGSLLRRGAARWAMVTTAVVLIALSFRGAWSHTAALATLERSRTVAPREAQWSTGQPRRFSLGRVTVPVGGVVRIEACGRASAPRGVSLSLVRASGPTVTVALSVDGSFSPRCLVGHHRALHGGDFDASITAHSPRELTEVEVRTGGFLGLRALWPLVLFALGLAMVVFASTLSRRETRTADPTDDRHTVELAERANPLVIVALALVLPQVGAAVGAFVSGDMALKMLASLAGQHVALVIVSLVCLGGWRDGGLERMGLRPISWRWAGIAVLSALGLVALAAGVSVGLDVRDTPLARELSRAPMRVVIAWASFGAPLSEELLYRGVLLATFSRVGPRSAVLAQAVIFTAMHAVQLQGAWLGLVPIAAVGLVNGWLRWKSDSLVAPWIVHTVYNGALVASAITSV